VGEEVWGRPIISKKLIYKEWKDAQADDPRSPDPEKQNAKPSQQDTSEKAVCRGEIHQPPEGTKSTQ
jgi:hypothetical protein